MIKKIHLLIGIMLTSSLLFAQTPIRLGYYLDHDYLQNAASTQNDSAKWKFNFYTQHKFLREATPIWNKPPQFMLDAHYQVENVGTFSLLLGNDHYSFFNRTMIGLGYSARYEKKGWFLQPGFRIIGNLDNYNLSKIHIPTTSSTDRNQTKLLADIDAGLVMGYKKLEVQLAYNHFTKTSLLVNNYSILSNKPHWLINAKYRFELGEKWELTPFIQVYNERNTTFDIGVQTGMKEKFKVGYQLRLIHFAHIYHLNIQATKALQIRAAVGHSSLYSDINTELGIYYKLYK